MSPREKGCLATKQDFGSLPFANDILERVEDQEDYGEIRFIALGRVDTKIYRVVYTWRADNLIRIISAQKASKDEKEIYYRATLP